jgi:pyruvate dehydrogenase E2 component (dihydrolipoamide acetyltransferase)
MIRDVQVPTIGENIESGDVVKVLVSKGDTVDVDQSLIELETDKAVVEIPSPYKGKVAEILVRSGDTVKIGQAIIKIYSDEAKESKEKRSAKSDRPAPKASAPSTPAEAPKSRAEQSTAVADESEPEPDTYVAAPSSPAAPSVRRLARELGVELERLKGTGSSGRITADDVRGFVKTSVTRAAEPLLAKAVALPDFSRWGTVDREPLNKVRRITAESTTRAWTTIPHVTQHDDADITGIEEFRKKHAQEVEAAGGKLTMTAILLPILASALKTFPRFNASLDAPAGELILKKYYNIGVAVDTDRGLLVPVVRDVDKKNLVELAVELHDLAERTRSKNVMPDELEGGSFTISNLGGIGGTGFTPIVYAPQVAILGVSRASTQPRWVDGAFRPRTILPLALSYDHRVIDGADGARFLRWVADALENPFLVALHG